MSNKLSAEEQKNVDELAALLALELAIGSDGWIDITNAAMVIVGAYVMGLKDGSTHQKNQVSDSEIQNLFFPKE